MEQRDFPEITSLITHNLLVHYPLPTVCSFWIQTPNIVPALKFPHWASGGVQTKAEVHYSGLLCHILPGSCSIVRPAFHLHHPKPVSTAHLVLKSARKEVWYLLPTTQASRKHNKYLVTATVEGERGSPQRHAAGGRGEHFPLPGPA